MRSRLASYVVFLQLWLVAGLQPVDDQHGLHFASADWSLRSVTVVGQLPEADRNDSASHSRQTFTVGSYVGQLDQPMYINGTRADMFYRGGGADEIACGAIQATLACGEQPGTSSLAEVLEVGCSRPPWINESGHLGALYAYVP